MPEHLAKQEKQACGKPVGCFFSGPPPLTTTSGRRPSLATHFWLSDSSETPPHQLTDGWPACEKGVRRLANGKKTDWQLVGRCCLSQLANQNKGWPPNQHCYLRAQCALTVGEVWWKFECAQEGKFRNDVLESTKSQRPCSRVGASFFHPNK